MGQIDSKSKSADRSEELMNDKLRYRIVCAMLIVLSIVVIGYGFKLATETIVVNGAEDEHRAPGFNVIKVGEEATLIPGQGFRVYGDYVIYSGCQSDFRKKFTYVDIGFRSSTSYEIIVTRDVFYVSDYGGAHKYIVVKYDTFNDAITIRREN